MASDIATRLKARLTRRRRSASVNSVSYLEQQAQPVQTQQKLATSSSTSFLRPRLASRQQSRTSRVSAPLAEAGAEAEAGVRAAAASLAASTSASSLATPSSPAAISSTLTVVQHPSPQRHRDRDKGRDPTRVQQVLPVGAVVVSPPAAPTQRLGQLEAPLETQARGQSDALFPSGQRPPPSPSSSRSPTSPPSPLPSPLPLPSSLPLPGPASSSQTGPAATHQISAPPSLSASAPAGAASTVAEPVAASFVPPSAWQPQNQNQDSPPPPPVSHQSLGSSQLRSIREYSFPPAGSSSSGNPTASDPTNAVQTQPPDDAAPDSHHGTISDHDLLSAISSALVTPAASSIAGATVAPCLPSDPEILRQQSIFTSRQTSLIKSLLNSIATTSSFDAAAISASAVAAAAADSSSRVSFDVNMGATRKIWVKRPHGSATNISINEDDLVDDVRDLILHKYANSLGRTFDSPDLNIRVFPRDHDKDRLLGPEEIMSRTLDRYFPGGQSVEEALVIDIPRRTPKPSPRAPLHTGTASYYLADDGRPSEAGEGYFPPVVAVPSPHPHAMHSAVSGAPPNGSFPHSIAVLGTGHIPPVPSPGGGTSIRPRAVRERSDRPRVCRQHTSSPTILDGHPVSSAGNTMNMSHNQQHAAIRIPRSRTQSTSSDHPPPLPSAKMSMPKSPPLGVAEPISAPKAETPVPRMSSPRPSNSRPKKMKKNSDYPQTVRGGAAIGTATNGNGINSNNVLNGIVPPISVLIVEDNPINLKLLEAFVKRLKVRWQTAMNGRDAVKKWRTGGFHLVLMDIQLPVMNGLDATREIRRLERVNSIGVFSSTPSSGLPPEEDGELKAQDRLENHALFKSPVIIVALTASSLQSDRHDALAAGCNDFLTKPVNFVWLERKVMEWGCMQALIDFDGWRKWKDFSDVADVGKTQAMGVRTRSKLQRSSASSSA